VVGLVKFRLVVSLVKRNWRGDKLFPSLIVKWNAEIICLELGATVNSTVFRYLKKRIDKSNQSTSRFPPPLTILLVPSENNTTLEPSV
jgi:hypothetical protein